MTDPLVAGLILFLISGAAFMAYHDPELFGKIVVFNYPILIVIQVIIITWAVSIEALTLILLKNLKSSGLANHNTIISQINKTNELLSFSNFLLIFIPLGICCYLFFLHWLAIQRYNSKKLSPQLINKESSVNAVGPALPEENKNNTKDK